METVIKYWILTGEIIWENWTLIFAIIYCLLMIYFQRKYYKERAKNIKLRSKNIAAWFALSITWKMIVDLLKENKKHETNLKWVRKSREFYRSQAGKYKKYFYAYDIARNAFFQKWSIAWAKFYHNYCLAKKFPMKKLNESFVNARKKTWNK